MALGGDGLDDHRLQREPGVVERARDLQAPVSPEIAPWRFWPVSSAYSCAAISAAPRTPARGPCRAMRIVVFMPRPGATCRNAASRAGASSSSPARETPPPITTSSGSNVLIALAIPIPSRSPRTRRHHSDGSSPASAPAATRRAAPPARPRGGGGGGRRALGARASGGWGGGGGGGGGGRGAGPAR